MCLVWRLTLYKKSVPFSISGELPFTQDILRYPRKNLDQYDEIYLGYPNYCGTMPMAVYTFLESFDFTGKKIHPFCTHEGSGLSGTEQDIRNAAKGAAVGKGLAIHGSSVDAAKPALQKWIQEGC